ncbi:MAG: plastocyanin/azurin family copper-binding protein [Candidatus Paceibacterota bacterium]|jgi:amicyanin
MKKVIVILVILGIIFGIYYFTKSYKTGNQSSITQTSTTTNTQVQTPATTPTNTGANTTVPTKKIYNVSIINFSFNPATLNINKGDTVVWTNNDSAPHTIKSDNLSNLSGPTMSKGQIYSFTFNDTGTFNYHCAIHPMMKANIIVK